MSILKNLFKSLKGDQGPCGPMGPMGMRGKDADPYEVAMILSKDKNFLEKVAEIARKEKK